MTRLETLLNFLATDPEDSFTRYGLALEYLSLNETEKGLALLKETIDRDPGYVAAYQQLGQQLYRFGQNEEAILYYKQGIEKARAIRNTHAASEMTNELEEILEEIS